MFGNFRIIHPESFIKSMAGLAANRGEMFSIPATDFQIREARTSPLKDFKFPDKFPWCCKTHKKLLNNGIDKFIEFPNCCDAHKKLNTAKWFKKSDYSYLPIKFLLTYTYTGHVIDSCIDLPDWYKRITDYFEYTERSFGQLPEGYGPPVGVGMYINSVKAYIDAVVKSITKKKKLLEYFDHAENKSSCTEMVDISLLVKRYKEWLSIFPFDISIFTHLKSYFIKRIPVLKGPFNTNMYTGLTKSSIISIEEMAEFLTKTTQTILQTINAVFLYENNLLEEPDKLNIELTVAKRKLQLKEYNELSSDSTGYRTLIVNWLKEEKEFLDEISPLLKRNDQKKPFILNIIDGIIDLQNQDQGAAAIANLRAGGSNKEAAFRNHFKTFLAGRYQGATITAEELKGNNHIDLKISSKQLGEKIIEFKGWWNKDKETLPEQICSYLTDTHPEGYIFMINHCKEKDITGEYRNKITSKAMRYVPGTWKPHEVPGTQLIYYETQHKFAIKPKTLFHFIFNAYFSAKQ